MATATLAFAGWDSITDVACPCKGCDGVLRWAEAGYVPGYRICDGSKHHHHFALDGGKLVEQRDRREKGAPIDRQAEREKLIRIDAADGARHAEASVKSDGIDICAYWSKGNPGYETGAAVPAYWARLAELAPEAVDAIRELQAVLPPSVSLCNLLADGTVMLYRQCHGRQLGGGTYLARADRILAAGPHPAMMADEYAELIGATRGYRVPK